MQDSPHFDRVARQWCEATGTAAWPAGTDVHVTIADAVVGLVHHDKLAPDCLHVFTELGSFDTADIHRRLLEMNIAVRPGIGGYFALHPQRGTVVFRVAVPLTEATDGAALPALIGEGIAVARQMLHA